MTELEYKKQLVYLPKSLTLNLLRFAEAHTIPSLDISQLPLHHQFTDELRFACGQLSNLIWECWENIKHDYKPTLKIELELTPRRRSPFITLEGKVLRAKYFSKNCQEILEDSPALDGHLSNVLELRFAFPEEVWTEMRQIHLAEERSYSAFLLQVLEMYEYKIVKGKAKKDLSGTLNGIQKNEKKEEE